MKNQRFDSLQLDHIKIIFTKNTATKLSKSANITASIGFGVNIFSKKFTPLILRNTFKNWAFFDTKSSHFPSRKYEEGREKYPTPLYTCILSCQAKQFAKNNKKSLGGIAGSILRTFIYFSFHFKPKKQIRAPFSCNNLCYVYIRGIHNHCKRNQNLTP